MAGGIFTTEKIAKGNGMIRCLMFLVSIMLFLTSCTTEYPELPAYSYTFRDDSLCGMIGADSISFKKGWCKTGTRLVQGMLYDIDFAGDLPDTTELKLVRKSLGFAIPLDSSVHYLSEWNTEITLHTAGAAPQRIDSGAVQILAIDKTALKMVAQIDMWNDSVRLNGTFTLPILK